MRRKKKELIEEEEEEEKEEGGVVGGGIRKCQNSRDGVVAPQEKRKRLF